MKIKQFAVYKKKSELLLKQICQYEVEADIPIGVINEYKQVSNAIIEYEAAYHPLPGRVNTIINTRTAEKQTSSTFRIASIPYSG